MIKNWIRDTLLGVRHDKILVVSGQQASGKSTFIRMIDELTDVEVYHARVNDTLERCACSPGIVVLDEPNLDDALYDRLKHLVTAEEIRYELKGSSTILDYPQANIIVLTNYVVEPSRRIIVAKPLEAINMLLSEL